MKIKGIAAVCKRRKEAVVVIKFTETGEVDRQYVVAGDFAAIYPIDGLPQLDEQSLLTVFDVPRNERLEWDVRISTIDHTNAKKAIDDNDESDKLVRLEEFTIAYKGTVCQPIFTPYGLVYLDVECLKPFKDEGKSVEYWARRLNVEKPPVVIAKVGMQMVACINPVFLEDAELADKLKMIAADCKRRADEKALEEAEAGG